MFGGKGGTIDVMGAFEIVKVCDGALVEEWFRVVVQLEECGHNGLKRVAAVDIFFEDLVIIINSKHETWVTTICLLIYEIIKLQNACFFSLSANTPMF